MKKISRLGFAFVLAASFAATTFTAPVGAASNVPVEAKYTDTQSGQVYGEKMNDNDMSAMGISLGSSLQNLTNELGKPDDYNLKAGRSGISVTYDGVTFFGNPVDRIVIVDKSHATNRGIKVGDKLDAVSGAYGQPDLITDTYWFYGQFKAGTNEKYGILFFYEGNKVTRILITSGV